MLRLLLFTILGLLLAACRGGEVRREKSGPVAGYLDLSRLFEEQSILLDSAGAGLYKVAWVDQYRDSASLSHDFRGWLRELAPLQEAHIPESILPLSYRVEREVAPRQELVSFISRYRKQTAVDSLAIRYRNGYPLQITAIIQDENRLYSSFRQIEAEFDSTDVLPLLRSYKLRGWQKMIGKDTVRLGIEAWIH